MGRGANGCGGGFPIPATDKVDHMHADIPANVDEEACSRHEQIKWGREPAVGDCIAAVLDKFISSEVKLHLGIFVHFAVDSAQHGDQQIQQQNCHNHHVQHQESNPGVVLPGGTAALRNLRVEDVEVDICGRETGSGGKRDKLGKMQVDIYNR